MHRLAYLLAAVIQLCCLNMAVAQQEVGTIKVGSGTAIVKGLDAEGAYVLEQTARQDSEWFKREIRDKRNLTSRQKERLLSITQSQMQTTATITQSKNGGEEYTMVVGAAGMFPVGKAEVDVLLSALTSTGASMRLQRFPTIYLVVQPSPPRDYTVTINDESSPATDRGIYRVPIGDVSVRVERQGKAPCTWKGTLNEGGRKELSCLL